MDLIRSHIVRMNVCTSVLKPQSGRQLKMILLPCVIFRPKSSSKGLLNFEKLGVSQWYTQIKSADKEKTESRVLYFFENTSLNYDFLSQLKYVD